MFVTALEYLKKEFEKAERSMQFARQKPGVTEEELKNIGKKLDLIAECIHCVENYREQKPAKPLTWMELQTRKAKPVYIKEKQVYSDEWFGWWDILDDVFPDHITTAYSEEMLKEKKGKTWNIYDVCVD